MSPEHFLPVSREHIVLESDSKPDAKNDLAGMVEELNMEEGEAHKTFYSKGSVIMMVVFSGLAIGSDG